MSDVLENISPKPKVLKSGLIFLWIVLGAAVFPTLALGLPESWSARILYISGFLGVALIAAIIFSILRWRHFKQGKLPKIVWVIIFLIVGFLGQAFASVTIDNFVGLITGDKLSNFGSSQFPSRSGFDIGGGGVISPLKPVIYLYPEETTNVFVNVLPKSGISYSEPQIASSGWQVVANPDGRLIDADNRAWPYLFWEGNPWDLPVPEEGFVMARHEIDSFFDEKLAWLGMNIQEITDFKEYWVPVMQEKPYYFVTFVPQNIYSDYAPLLIEPTPDTVIRVYFHHEGLDKPIDVRPQILEPAPKRTGFTVVEWGGNGMGR